MAFGSLEGEEDNAPLAEINMVPLIDVMLVLLVIFIVTAPMLTHAVKVDLPKASSALNITKPDHVQLAIDAENHLFWNGAAVEMDALKSRLKDAAAVQPQPELHIRADRTTPYEKVAQVMSLAASEGLSKIGFVTDPALAAP
ncbi:MAG: biopolymer transporter ExbD [Aquabacterium sp.]|uniref:ExbD/TolR family protein n=1 Tax=Aquabacterium sp. TaxID=1872578 RepID=UPI00121A452E|nr:biopolymer transporter ExbD [Aquabacterium sp.]TAK98452.1 MAG: biopolymer transporter ExbD [Aquabacterium sp.]